MANFVLTYVWGFFQVTGKALIFMRYSSLHSVCLKTNKTAEKKVGGFCCSYLAHAVFEVFVQESVNLVPGTWKMFRYTDCTISI